MDVLASIAAATSNDEFFPPENVLNMKENNFWLTTGIYPQTLILMLEERTKVKSVKLVSACVKSILLESAPNDLSDKFETAAEMNVDINDGQIQITKIPLNCVLCKRLKLTIIDGYDHFAAIYKLVIEK